MYEDENNLYHYSYRKGNEYDPNVPIDTKNYADEPSDQNRGSGSGKKKGAAKIVALALVCALVGGLVGAGASSAAAKVNHTSIQISDREVAQVQTVKVRCRSKWRAFLPRRSAPSGRPHPPDSRSGRFLRPHRRGQ